MRKLNLLSIALGLMLTAGCVGGVAPKKPPTSPPAFGDGTGTIVMRTGTPPSDLQALATAAGSPATLARYSVAHPEHDFYLMRNTPIAESGYSEVSSSVPVGTGFETAVVGYVPHPTSPDSGIIVSAAATPEVNIFQDQVTEVDFDIHPFEYEFIYDDEVVIGEGDSTVTLKVTSPIALGPNPMVIMGPDPWQSDGGNSMVLASDPVYEDGVYTTKWAINHPAQPTKIYFQVVFFTDLNRWIDPTAEIKFLTVPIPSLSLGDELPYIDFVIQ